MLQFLKIDWFLYAQLMGYKGKKEELTLNRWIKQEKNKAEDSSLLKNNSDNLPIMNGGLSQEELKELTVEIDPGVKNATSSEKWNPRHLMWSSEQESDSVPETRVLYLLDRYTGWKRFILLSPVSNEKKVFAFNKWKS